MKPPSRLTVILQAVFVTFLWSTSWVLIKFGLRSDLPPITFAGLRYSVGFLCLVPFVLFNPKQRAALKNLSRADWGKLTLLGLLVYTITQSAQFLSLSLLPAVMVSLLYNLTPILVGLLSVFTTKESPTLLQWIGIALAVIGTCIYFLPLKLPPGVSIGIGVAAIGVLANSLAALKARQANRDLALSPLLVTFVSMGIGSVLMLGIGLVVQGPGRPTLPDWGIIAWLGAVNTAFAFVLWNNTLRVLTAAESSILNSLNMPQVAILAILFLGEELSPKEIAGLVLVGTGVIVVQLRRRRSGNIAETRETPG